LKNKFSLVFVLFLSSLFSAYDVGDQISLDDQEMEFSFCYPESQANSSFSFAQHNGDLNGGNFQVLLIEMSTSW